MAVALQKHLETLVRDVHAIQKDLLLSGIRRVQRSRSAIASWTVLRQKVSAAWDSVSADEEITAQREKKW